QFVPRTVISWGLCDGQISVARRTRSSFADWLRHWRSGGAGRWLARCTTTSAALFHGVRQRGRGRDDAIFHGLLYVCQKYLFPACSIGFISGAADGWHVLCRMVSRWLGVGDDDLDGLMARLGGMSAGKLDQVLGGQALGQGDK